MPLFQHKNLDLRLRENAPLLGMMFIQADLISHRPTCRLYMPTSSINKIVTQSAGSIMSYFLETSGSKFGVHANDCSCRKYQAAAFVKLRHSCRLNDFQFINRRHFLLKPFNH